MHEFKAPMNTVSVMDLPLRVGGLSDHLELVRREALSGPDEDCKSFVLVNSATVAYSTRDDEYRSLLQSPNVINLCDGWPVTWLARRVSPQASHTRGPDLFRSALELDAQLRHFFLGGTEETLNKLVLAAHEMNPAVNIAGWFSPPFRRLTEDEYWDLNDRLISSGANLIWVGLGAPRQDFESFRISQQCGLTCVGIGAAFDFLADTKREAPVFVRRLGLEWLFRLVQEPARLWRRYTVENCRFVVAAIAWLVRHR